MASVSLAVDGAEYQGWKSARVTRGIECISGRFDLEASDRWSGQTPAGPRPIAKESSCVLYLEGQPMISGYIDGVSMSYGPADHRLSVSGRDRSGSLVDSSAFLGKWEFIGVPLETLVRRICEPFGIPVTVQSGLKIPRLPTRISIDPGDTAFEAIERACRMCGVLPIAYGEGAIILTRAGSEGTTTALVEGQNILAASATFDASRRYRRYIVTGQHPGNDEYVGDATVRVRGEALDATVRRAERVLVVRAEGSVTPAQAKLRAQWEAKVRAARGDAVTVRVQGWKQGDGKLWPVNALVPVESPTLGLRGESEMLITEATFSLDEQGGTTTELRLARPDAFLPEPVVRAARYEELAGGVKPD
jgi:prophage tail gpP-like protein